MERRLAAILVADVVGYSRLMGEDEEGTLQRLTNLRVNFIEPLIAKKHGRVVKLMGDGFLVEFHSVIEAVECALDWQTGAVRGKETDGVVNPLQFRIGINLGDVIVEDEDIYGDGVNVAARLEGLAKPGAICLSDLVHQSVASKLDLTWRDLGRQRIKNISKPVRVWQWSETELSAEQSTGEASALRDQEIHFCTAADSTQIAYATVGKGPPIVKAPNWMNHLEYDWQSPVWRHLLRDLSRDHALIRFDQRGNGLSDWDVADISHDAFVADLENVVDAAGLDRFALFGVSQGCGISIRYAVRHPERVSCLVLYGGYSKGRCKRGSKELELRAQTEWDFIAQGWGQDNPAFRQFFTSTFVPRGTMEQLEWFNELQRIATPPENAVRIRKVMDHTDVTDLLPQVSVPTLVMHCRNDAVAPFEEGRRIAAAIPGARFVALEGRNHLILEDEPAWPRFIEEFRGFLASVENS